MAKNLFNYVKKFLPLIGIFILIYLIIRLDVVKIKDAFLSIKPIYILLSLSLTIPALLLRTYSWQLIQKEQKIKLGFFQSFKIFLIGTFYGAITPGFLGQLMRVPYMQEKTGEPYGKVFVNIAIEVILRTIAVLALELIGALIILGIFSRMFLIIVAVFAFFTLIFLYFIKKERGEKSVSKIVKYFIPKKFKDDSYKFVNTFYTDFPRIRRLIIPFILSILTWMIVFSQIYIVAIALDVNIPYFYFILLFPIAYTLGYLPITIAGLGARDYTAVLLFSTLFGASEPKILVVTLVGFLITDIFLGALGFIVTLTEARSPS